MPNIVMVGYDPAQQSTKEIEERIEKVMENLGIKDAVLTSFPFPTASVRYLNGHRKSAPFIIIRGSSRSEIRRIIKGFKRACISNDVEVEKIEGFIPWQKMRPSSWW